tara:strand:+ start:1586 stop:3022 length:1437 start_codon:yes stop_codon:yes gene_type:complete
MSFKTNKINRNFTLKVHLYFNKDSFNRTTDSTPRFYLKPVQLLGVEKVAFTRGGAVTNGYKKYGNRFWKYKYDDTLTNAQIDSIYNEIKQSYPYGFVDGDQASIKKYRYDVKENQAFQSFYKQYWDQHQDEVKQTKLKPDGTKIHPHPYIEFTVNEIISYKHVKGAVDALPEASLDTDYGLTGASYSQPDDYSCHHGIIDVNLNAGTPDHFLIDGYNQFPLILSTSGRYLLNLRSGDQNTTDWPTGVGAAHSGYRFRVSTGPDGSHNGFSDYTSGISYVVSPETAYYDVSVQAKTAVSGPGDDGHPYMYSGSASGYALSGISGSATGINASGFGYDEGAEISLRRDSTYYFYQTGATNSGHPLRFATHPSGAGDSATLYESGASYGSNYVKFEVPGRAPNTLYYVCNNHSYMGGKINIVDAPTAPKTGSVPGESIVIDNNQTGIIGLYYYSPDISGAGGLLNLVTECDGSQLFQGYSS